MLRAGFIDAPEIGLPHRPASAMYPPTPSGAEDAEVLGAGRGTEDDADETERRISSIQNASDRQKP